MESFNCQNTIFTSCIKYTGDTLNTTDCTLNEICAGTELNDILENFYDTLCSVSEVCKIKVSSTDDCCNYLQGKLTSTDNSISFTKNSADDSDGNSCETLNLSSTYSPIIINDQTQYDLVNIGDFNTYTITAGTVANNGDQIIIDTWFQSDTVVSDNPGISIKLNGSAYIILGFLSTIASIQIHTEINRITTSTARTKTDYTFFTAPSFSIYPSASTFTIVSTVSNIDFTSDITFTPSFSTDSASNITMSNIGFTIKYFKK